MGRTINPIISGGGDADYVTKWSDTGDTIGTGSIPSGATTDILIDPRPCPPTAGWTPPDYWDWDTVAAEITDSDDGFVALVAVFPNKVNYITFRMDYTGGGGTIDWGDGTTSALGATTTTNEKTLSYAGVASAVTDRGYKIAKVKILISGTLNSVYYSRSHSFYSVYNFTTPYLAIKQRSGDSSMGYSHNNPFVAGLLELLDLGGTSEISISQTFRAHGSLKKITWKPPTVAFSAQALFSTNVIEPTLMTAFNLDNIDWDLATTMLQTFYFANGNLGVFEQSITNVASLQQAWRSSQAHSSVILTNTGNVTSINQTIYQSAVAYFSMDDASGVTDTTNFVRPNNGYNQLTGLILTGLTVGINISYSPMTATALDAFFTSLGTASGAQTITITGCLGAATANTAIATAKGFTVIN